MLNVFFRQPKKGEAIGELVSLKNAEVIAGPKELIRMAKENEYGKRCVN
jgi:hypothetical protein